MSLTEYIKKLERDLEIFTLTGSLLGISILKKIISELKSVDTNQVTTPTKEREKERHCRHCRHDSDTHAVCSMGKNNGSGIPCQHYKEW